MQVTHQEQNELAIAQQEFAEQQDHQAAKMTVCAIECIKAVDMTPGTMRIIIDALSHKLNASTMSHAHEVQCAVEKLDEAAFFMAEMEEV